MEIGSPDWENLIIDGAKAFQIRVDRQMVRQFSLHARDLLKWNQKINLTAITDPHEIALKHFLDSLAPARWIPPSATLLDIGSGGGFPGIVLKVLIPSLAVTLIDGSRKKINFLKHCIRTLRLENIEALQVRAEELTKDVHVAWRFDVIISRALSSLAQFVRLAMPLLADRGIIIALKGEMDQQEIARLQSTVLEKTPPSTDKSSAYALTLENYRLPVIQSKRSMLIIRKAS
jgi:16S rRNA (guanine527-N7)-methyltransferase